MAFSKGFSMMMKAMGIDPIQLGEEMEQHMGDVVARAISSDPTIQQIKATLEAIEKALDAAKGVNYTPPLPAELPVPPAEGGGGENPMGEYKAPEYVSDGTEAQTV